VAGSWRRLYNEELRNLYDSNDIIRVIKSRRLRWAGHVARIRHNLKEIGVGRIILKRILRNLNMSMLTGFIWLRIRSSGGLL